MSDRDILSEEQEQWRETLASGAPLPTLGGRIGIAL
jgi:hypothetical protein